MANTWITAVDLQIVVFVEHGRTVGGSATAMTVGGMSVTGVSKVIGVALSEDVPVEAAAPAVAVAIAAEVGDVVLAANRPAERVLAGAVAARLSAAFLPGLKSVKASAAELSCYGGLSFKSVTFDSPAVAVLDGGVEAGGEPMFAETAEDLAYNAKVTGQEETEVVAINLGAVKRVVSAGRGFKAKEDLELAEELTAAIGAEPACPRPLAEGANRMAVDHYVGVSGQVTSPKFYIAAGISGQIQHTVGMSNSKVVVAVNNGPKASMFAGADYGVVGDLYEILPASTEAVKQES